MLRSRARHENVLKLNQNEDLLAKNTLLMMEQTCRSMDKVSNGKRPASWLLLLPDLVVFLLSRNLHKTCTMELVPRTPHRIMAYDMAGVTTIEIQAIVTMMLALSLS